jgi:hypothetical protein
MMVVYLDVGRPQSATLADSSECPPLRNRGAAAFPELLSQNVLDRPAKGIRAILGWRVAWSAAIASGVPRRQLVLGQILAAAMMFALIVLAFY